MAKKELFDDIRTRKLLHWLGAFSVNQQKLEISTMKTVKDVFKTDWWLGIFPQGGIIRYEPVANVNKGFAYIAKIAKVDILPVGISGSEKLTFIPFSRKVYVKIGKPISHNLSLDEIVVQWAKQVGELSGYGNAPENELTVDKRTDNT